MLLIKRIPRLLRWVLSIVLLLLLLMTIFRFIFYWHYNPAGKAISGSAFILGLRFDARMACIAGLAILLLCCLPPLNPFKRTKARRFWNIFLTLLILVLFIFYAVDFFYYDYLRQRLNASALNYFEDAGISATMVWQTYPVAKVFGSIFLLLIAAAYLLNKLLLRYQREATGHKKKGVLFFVATILVFGLLIFGKIGQYPLRWSDAFGLSDEFKANLALNPFQSFFSTLSFRSSGYDIKKVKASYLLVSSFLGVQSPDSVSLNFERKYEPSDSSQVKPNIVLVICESFSGYKSSMWGNPLNTTPYFNELCRNGIFFDRCFTPSYGTARGIWAVITGIPDVESPRTASRNPAYVNQHSIINDLKGYEKFYFLGGSTSWANIRGVLTNNISDLHLYEQEDFKAPKVDVWGVSDKNLFLESQDILQQQKQPFFAVIQTAGNHRPYTIPSEDTAEFKKVNFPIDTLKEYGFESNEEMNAFRYTDFCFQKFIEAAKKQKYFDNTIFVFVGDHGIGGNAGGMLPKAYTSKGLNSEHVPLLFYSPKLLQPQRVSNVCSQLDVLPSIASLVKTSYRNTTMGRSLFDTANSGMKDVAFITDPDEKTIGVVTNSYYFKKRLKSGEEDFVSITDNEEIKSNAANDSIRNSLKELTEGLYETAKYMLRHNEKKE